VGDLLDVIYEKLEDIGRPPIDPLKMEGTRVAVIGKPNVGKSTLLNALIGEERFITSSIEHTTREPNDTLFQRGEQKYIFIDTAGMRKHAKVRKAGGLEHEAVKRNELVVKLADVTLLVLDATQKIGTQEKVLAGFLKHSGSAVLIIVNKWDLVADKETNTMNDYREYIAASLPFLAWAPVHFVSALSKQRVQTLFDAIDAVNKNRNIDISQEKLKAFLDVAMKQFAPVVGHGPWAPKILGMKQTRHAPPTFDLIIKAKRTDTLNLNYIRYLENRLREQFKLTGTPVAIDIRLATSVSK
jgi:GTP-binding protein